MAVTVGKMRGVIIFCGLVSYALGILAESKRPAFGIMFTEKGVVKCKYASDLTVVLSYLSLAFLLATAVVGHLAIFYPYKGRAIPQGVLFSSTIFLVFYIIALIVTGFAAMFLLWPIHDQLHFASKVYHNFQTDGPTVMIGLLGAGAILSFDSSLVWLVAIMLATNAKEDYFD